MFLDTATADFQSVKYSATERILFRGVKLRPNWFVNVDSRKFVFHDIDWGIKRNVRDFINSEIDGMKSRRITNNPLRLLCISARQLAENAESNNNLEVASNFREMAFEIEVIDRKDKQGRWWQERFLCSEFLGICWSKLITAPYDLLHFLYRLLSFYGESWFRAAWILVAAWFLFGLFYWSFGNFGEDKVLSFAESLGYSSSTMLLQKPDIQTHSNLTFTLRVLEMIFSPLQAALLALAIRRKFMR